VGGSIRAYMPCARAWRCMHAWQRARGGGAGACGLGWVRACGRQIVRLPGGFKPAFCHNYTLCCSPGRGQQRPAPPSAMARHSPRDKRGVVGIPRAHGGGWGVARVMVGLWHTEQCEIECEIERRSGATAGRAASDRRGVPRGNCRGAGQLVGGVGGVHASSEVGNRPRAHVVRGVGRTPCYLPLRPRGGRIHGCKVGASRFTKCGDHHASVLLVGVGYRPGGGTREKS